MNGPATQEPDFTGLRAMYINCTLNRSPDRSHTQGVIDRSVAIMEANGVGVDQIRAVDHDIATGVRPDMTEHGWDTDPAPVRRGLARRGRPRPLLPRRGLRRPGE